MVKINKEVSTGNLITICMAILAFLGVVVSGLENIKGLQGDITEIKVDVKDIRIKIDAYHIRPIPPTSTSSGKSATPSQSMQTDGGPNLNHLYPQNNGGADGALRYWADNTTARQDSNQREGWVVIPQLRSGLRYSGPRWY